MDSFDFLSEYTENTARIMSDSMDKYVRGWRQGKNGRWIMETYKGIGRPRKEDYQHLETQKK